MVGDVRQGMVRDVRQGMVRDLRQGMRVGMVRDVLEYDEGCAGV